jgi:cell division protein ZapE
VLQAVARQARGHGFELDDVQRQAIRYLQRLYRDLAAAERHDRGWLLKLFRRRSRIPGVYLWGGVGRGKSFLMDGFFDVAPLVRKRRVHFHRFMQGVHRSLARLQGTVDPLAAIARELGQRFRLICLDEFHITDITDAMLMRGLLEGLIENGVVLVTTSNQHPDKLYEHGLQRTQFLPAIDLIKRELDVIHVAGPTDYRLRELERAGVYHVAADGEAQLERAFAAISDGADDDTMELELEIEDRVIRARRHASGVAWFDFSELCDGPRGKADYIELARRYHTVMISGIPQLAAEVMDIARRFTWLIDEFYDRRVKLIVTAAAAPAALWARGHAPADFERTVSRLIEMQSREYLSEPHLP